MGPHFSRPRGSDVRSQTLAFRLSTEERAQIDALARTEGISTSEFARRAVFGTLRELTSALAAAREQGHNAVLPQLAAMRGELAVMRQRVVNCQRHSAILQRELDEGPEELMTAVLHLVAGGSGAKRFVARCWSRIGYRDRLRLIPIVAARVADEIDPVLATLPFTEAAEGWLTDLVERLGWLADAITPEAGRTELAIPRELRGERGPLEAVYRDTLKRLAGRVEAMKSYEELRPTKGIAEYS